MWTLVESEADEWRGVDDPLPSDCRFRQDLDALRRGDVAAAQQLKELLENRQRRDAKLRKGLT
jgi:Oxysterol-binding protein